jgi:hypothetical protein
VAAAVLAARITGVASKAQPAEQAVAGDLPAIPIGGTP